jgi:hypothetical protein
VGVRLPSKENSRAVVEPFEPGGFTSTKGLALAPLKNVFEARARTIARRVGRSRHPGIGSRW